MFGYIKPVPCLMSNDEKKLYKAAYCGLCHSLGKICSASARFTLSYDFVFLALVRMAALGETPNITTKKCPSHPVNGCPVLQNSPSLDYCAALSALLTYESLQDKLQDEKGLSHFTARLCKIPSKRFLKNALTQCDLPIKSVRQHLTSLYDLEKQQCYLPDIPAEIFGQMLAEVSCYGIEDELLQFAIEKIMFRVGKWIYLIDAADDFKKDQKKGAYNPFLPNGPDPMLLSNSLEWELSFCDDLIDKLPCKDPAIRNIIENILYNGTRTVSQTILFPTTEAKGIEKENDRPL